MAPGQPVFDDLRRCSGAECKRGPVERFTGRRWNGAEWNRLELAKSGPFRRRCVVGSCFRRLIGGLGFADGLLPPFEVFSGLLCKSLIINGIYLNKTFCMDGQCPASCAKITTACRTSTRCTGSKRYLWRNVLPTSLFTLRKAG
jgi:hypothetical protein